MPRPWLCFLALALAVLSFGCDHGSKHLAEGRLTSGAVSVVPGVLELRYAENHDTAFSLSRVLDSPGKGTALTALALLGTAVALASWWRKRKERSPAIHFGHALIVSGALGNGIDRLLRGYVVDFIHVTHWPIFNVADIAVTVGVALLVLDGVRKRRAKVEAT